MSKNSKKGTRKAASRSGTNKNPIIIMSVILVGLFIWIMSQLSGPGTPLATSNQPVTAPVVNGVQMLSMNLTAAGYEPNNITLKKDIPVQINTNATADAGCVRGLMIPDFDINKALDVGQDSFVFIPNKTGNFEFSCQMRMSTGTINIV